MAIKFWYTETPINANWGLTSTSSHWYTCTDDVWNNATKVQVDPPVTGDSVSFVGAYMPHDGPTEQLVLHSFDISQAMLGSVSSYGFDQAVTSHIIIESGGILKFSNIFTPVSGVVANFIWAGDASNAGTVSFSGNGTLPAAIQVTNYGKIPGITGVFTNFTNNTAGRIGDGFHVLYSTIANQKPLINGTIGKNCILETGTLMLGNYGDNLLVNGDVVIQSGTFQNVTVEGTASINQMNIINVLKMSWKSSGLIRFAGTYNFSGNLVCYVVPKIYSSAYSSTYSGYVFMTSLNQKIVLTTAAASPGVTIDFGKVPHRRRLPW